MIHVYTQLFSISTRFWSGLTHDPKDPFSGIAEYQQRHHPFIAQIITTSYTTR